MSFSYVRHTILVYKEIKYIMLQIKYLLTLHISIDTNVVMTALKSVFPIRSNPPPPCNSLFYGYVYFLGDSLGLDCVKCFL